MRKNFCKIPLDEIEIKEGDVIDVVSLEWREPNWEFDYPSILIYPILQLHTSGTCNETVIEQFLEHLTCINPKMKSDDLKWEEDFYGWNIKKLRRIANNRLNGKRDGIKNQFTVLKQKIKFEQGKEEWLDTKIIESYEF